MKQIIIATAIALAIPAVALAKDAPVAPATGAVAGSLPLFDRAKALHITPSQQAAYDTYLKAEEAAWNWEAAQIGAKNGYMAVATDAIDALYKSGLSRKQLDLLLGGGIDIRYDTPQSVQKYIDWRSNEAELTDEQKTIFAKYIAAGTYKLLMDAEVSKNVFDARKALNAKLSAKQLRIASDYALIDSRPAPRDEWSKFMGYVK